MEEKGLESEGDGDLESCPICLENLICVESPRTETRGCMIPMTLLCMHTFHIHCIVSWCEKEKKENLVATCPLCRQVVDIAQELKRNEQQDTKIPPVSTMLVDNPRMRNQRPLCRALTKKKRPCRNPAKFNNDGLCYVHQKPRYQKPLVFPAPSAPPPQILPSSSPQDEEPIFEELKNFSDNRRLQQEQEAIWQSCKEAKTKKKSTSRKRVRFDERTMQAANQKCLIL